MRFQHLIHVPLRYGLVELATLNIVLLGGQPKPFEDPFSFYFHSFPLLTLFFGFGILNVFIMFLF